MTTLDYLEKNDIKRICLFAVILAIVDTVWLYFGASKHKKMISSVQQDDDIKIDKVAALGFYLLAGIAYNSIIRKTSINNRNKTSALCGFLMYGTFDLTNKAIFKNYTWSYAISDILWGTFAFVMATIIIDKLT